MNTDIAERGAIAARTSRVLDDSLDLDSRHAEVDQQAKSFSGCPQVIDTLRAMRTVKRPHGFQFNEDSVLNQQIDKVLADQCSLISHSDPSLLFDGESRSPQFQRQRIFINFLTSVR
jgi:hypothetical protein